MAVCAGADILYLVQAANGNYTDPAVLNALYLLSFSLLAIAGWVPRSGRVAAPTEAPQTVILAAIAAAVALGLLVVGSLTEINPLAVALAAGALLAACARAALTYAENVRMLRASAREAVTDHLSGLGNRRQLMADLEEACARAGQSRPSTLVFFDLNGFKGYNDSFGHAAGDALLARIGASLQVAVGHSGRTYRLGGDEFCALLERPRPARRSSHRGDQPCPDRARQRLHRRRIARTGADSRRGAPRRAPCCNSPMSGCTPSKSRASRAQTRDVPLQLLDERAPGCARTSAR